MPEATSKVPGVRARETQQDPAWVKWTLISIALAVIGVLIVIPTVNVFYEAFSPGLAAYWTNITADRYTRHAIMLTLIVAPTAVVMNIVFGLAAAWAIARFKFRGRTLLTSLIDLPFSVSPVVAGLMLTLIFGLQGFLGEWLQDHNIKVIFAMPGLILATAFVTLPFVARELIPVMEAIGPEEEIAAVSLGASPWQMFWRITLPNIKWGLLYGVILCNARAMGEYGAVYVVSGRISGKTDTLPLRVEKILASPDENSYPAAFAVASLLTFLALVTLFAKVAVERRSKQQLAEAAQSGSEEP